MRVITLSCNQCGAPLEVSHRAKFVTCNFCTARLEIKREAGSTWTEELEELRSELRKLKSRAELTKYDERWKLSRRRLMNRQKNGEFTIPTRTGALAIFFVFFAPLSFVFAFHPDGNVLVGLIFLLVGIVVKKYQFSKADRFAEARDRYWKGRRNLIKRLREGA